MELTLYILVAAMLSAYAWVMIKDVLANPEPWVIVAAMIVIPVLLFFAI